MVALTPPPDPPKGPPRKRRRLLPYQGPDPDEPLTLRSSRLKRWVVGIGRRERDRIRNLKPVALSVKPKPRPEVDEIANERGVRLLQERGGMRAFNDPRIFSHVYLETPGSRPAIHLTSSERGFTLQHITDRLNLICAQHNLGSPSKSVATLMSLAFEVRICCARTLVLSKCEQAKLKSLIMQALAMTSASHAISSIHPSAPHSSGRQLSASAFDTLFTIAPSVLPNRSATATRLALGENESREDHILTNENREPGEPRWQMLALLRERSSVNEIASARK